VFENDTGAPAALTGSAAPGTGMPSTGTSGAVWRSCVARAQQRLHLLEQLARLRRLQRGVVRGSGCARRTAATASGREQRGQRHQCRGGERASSLAFDRDRHVVSLTGFRHLWENIPQTTDASSEHFLIRDEP
jgi:hypothetical protein